MLHLRRPKPLGIDPRLVLVFELGATVATEEWHRAGLRVLDGSDRRVVIAFADDPAMIAFHERIDALRAGVPEGNKSEPYAAFFDAIDDLRPLAPADRMTPEVVEAVKVSDPAEVMRLDIECWHPGERELAQEWLNELAEAVGATTGRVVDHMVHDGAGLLLARAYVPAGRITELAELDTIARIDVLPLPALTVPQLYGFAATDLPVVEAPDSRAPIIGIVDSGVQSAHPLIAPAVLAAEALSPSINEGEDEHGHGTMVAAILLHGNIEQALARGLPLRPSCKLVSVRVLGSDNEFPSAELWETDLLEAIEWCAGQGARIVNLSIGDDRRRLVGTRQLSAAALVDALARQHQLVIVVSSGNSRPHDYLERIEEAAALTYPAAHLREQDTVIIDPASAMLALTVGGITTAAAASGLSGRESVARVAMGRPGWPSPITRRGPGLNNSVKPELVERAGTLGIEGSRLVDNDAELGVVSAGIGPDRLLASNLGTSFAAPLVTRIAAAVMARFPEFSSNLVRALVLLSTAPTTFGDELETQTPGDRAIALRNLLGFGRPAIRRAVESTSHRAVLVADASIPIDGVHIYEIPVPSSFFASGGERGIDVALAFDPPTRARRLGVSREHDGVLRSVRDVG
ncbi:MAG: S8 family peptidase [Actinobacteria bacterium]|nr:S8 family peptidase [Actinomycetota bacterium]